MANRLSARNGHRSQGTARRSTHEDGSQQDAEQRGLERSRRLRCAGSHEDRRSASTLEADDGRAGPLEDGRDLLRVSGDDQLTLLQAGDELGSKGLEERGMQARLRFVEGEQRRRARRMKRRKQTEVAERAVREFSRTQRSQQPLLVQPEFEPCTGSTSKRAPWSPAATASSSRALSPMSGKRCGSETWESTDSLGSRVAVRS